MRIFLAFVFALLISAQAAASDTLRLIQDRGVLRVGTTGDYRPFSARLGKGEHIGLDIELASGLARAMGVTLQIVPTTWPTLLKDFKDDKFDIALGGVSITAERQHAGLFSLPYLSDGKTPIALCTHQARFQTLGDIDQAGVRLIVNPGGTNERFARSRAPHAQLIVYPDNVSIFDRLIEGKADLMITDAIEAQLQQHLHPELCAIHPDTPFDISEKAMLLQPDPELKAVVDAWLRTHANAAQRLKRWLDFPWPLEGLRQAIDRRLLLAESVARAKWNVQAPIEDLAREAQVVRAAVEQGKRLGLPAPWVEAVFRAQIEASKTVQRDLYATWRAEQRGQFADAPDLATGVRPELDKLTAQILQAMAAQQAVLQDPARRADLALAFGWFEAAALHRAAVQQAVAPLLSSSATLTLP